MFIPDVTGRDIGGLFDACDVGVYIHVPFCERRCRYCAFVSSVPRDVPQDGYVRAVCAELGARGGELSGRVLRTVYFGGGTPSMLDDAHVDALLSSVRASVPGFGGSIGGQLEVTLEANPEHVTASRASAWRAMGVTRVSLGVQYFDDGMLKFLGRRHDTAGAVAAVDALHGAGFDEVSIDLIYGGECGCGCSDAEGVRLWRRTLETAASIGAVHISCYELTPEPGTPVWGMFGRGRRVLCGEDARVDMMGMVPEVTGAARYEISNYGRNGAVSAHNLSCWAGVPYVGLGPGAHSMSLCGTGAGVVRRANCTDIGAYISACGAGAESLRGGFVEHVSSEMHLAERLICAARTCLKWSPSGMAGEVGASPGPYAGALDEAVRRGLVSRLDAGFYRTTPEGILLNNVLDEILFGGAPDG